MKNKIKVCLLPLAIGVFSLSSCNPYPMKWHVISDEKAEVVGRQIIKNQEAEMQTYKLPKILNFKFEYSLEDNGELLEGGNITCQYDEEGNYLKFETLDYYSKGDPQYIHNVMYYLKQNDKYYAYNPSKSEEKFEILATEVYKQRISYTTDTLYSYMIGNLIIGDIEKIPFFDNVLARALGLEDKEAFYKKSQRISSETKGSAEGYNSNYYFQMQEENSIEFYEYSYAPKDYFDLKLDNTKECKKELSFKFLNNYISTFESTYIMIDQNSSEVTAASSCSVTNTIVKDHIVIPE